MSHDDVAVREADLASDGDALVGQVVEDHADQHDRVAAHTHTHALVVNVQLHNGVVETGPARFPGLDGRVVESQSLTRSQPVHVERGGGGELDGDLGIAHVVLLSVNAGSGTTSTIEVKSILTHILIKVNTNINLSIAVLVAYNDIYGMYIL